MGALLHRPVGQEDRRGKKDKRKQRQQQLELSFGSDTYLAPDGNENEDPNIGYRSRYESWEKKFEPQQMINMNDPPGAPSTYSSNYSAMQNHLTTQAWPSPLNTNNSFYPVNTLQTAPSYNTPFISEQFNPAPDTYSNQPKTVAPEERLPKKVKFASSPSSSSANQTSTSKPLTSTKSWHESSDLSVPTAVKPMRLSNRSPLPRSSLQKPIYVGVDFQATLAERGQTSVNKHHRRKDGPKHSERSNPSEDHHRARLHAHHHHKNETPTNSPRSNVEITPNKLLDSQRVIRKSSSSNKLLQNSEQSPFMSYEIQPSKSRSNRREQSSMTNEQKSSKSREHHRRQHQESHSPFLNDSPSNIQSSTRRIEINQSSAPVLRIPLSQLNRQHQKQPIIISSATNLTKVHRIPIQT